MASLQAQLVEQQTETNRLLGQIVLAISGGALGGGAAAPGGGVGGSGTGAGGSGPAGAAAQQSLSALGQQAAARFGGGGAGVGAAGGLAGAGAVAGVSAAAVIGKEALTIGLNIAADATNPFKTGFQSTLSAVETIAGKLPFGSDIAQIAFNLSGITTERAANQSAFQEASGIAAGLVRSGVKLTDDDLRGIASAVKPVNLEVAQTQERLAKAFGEVPGGPIEELIKIIKDLIISLGGQRVRAAAGIPDSFAPAPATRGSAAGGERF